MKIADLRNNAGLWDRVFEYGYLLLAGLVTLMAFVDTTMMTMEQVGWMYSLIPWVRLLLLLFVGAKLAREPSWQAAPLLLALLLCGALLRSWQRVERPYILELALLIAGAHGIDFKKIAAVWFGVCAAGLLLSMTLALTGVIENLVYLRQGRTRMSFGIIYPTDFSAHVFFLAAAWAWIRERRITFWEIALIAALGVFCLVFCEARNTVLCLFLLTAGLLYLKLRERGGRPYAMVRPVQWMLVLSGPILAALMILLSALYRPEVGWMSWLDQFMSLRPSLGHQAFVRYSVSLFGQPVALNGLGGTANPTGEYIFLDSSYINILYSYGAVTLLFLLGAMLLSGLREKRLGAWEHLGILAVVVVHCALEHHMIEIAYNLFLLLPLAASGPRQDGGRHTAAMNRI
ncbi:MAG: hypothetical protein IKD79_04170 [Oscillospiraceae bacterium]|nr:hypothetical protein [Oscillospiraceae bacterium]